MAMPSGCAALTEEELYLGRQVMRTAHAARA